MVSIVFRAELTPVDDLAACHSPKREPRGLAGGLQMHGRIDIEHSP